MHKVYTIKYLYRLHFFSASDSIWCDSSRSRSVFFFPSLAVRASCHRKRIGYSAHTKQRGSDWQEQHPRQDHVFYSNAAPDFHSDSAYCQSHDIRCPASAYWRVLLSELQSYDHLHRSIDDDFWASKRRIFVHIRYPHGLRQVENRIMRKTAKSPLFMRFSAEKRCFSSNSLTKHMTVFKQQPGNSCP